MRFTTLILILSIMQVSASSYAQKISLSERKTSLDKIFTKISRQTGYDFLVTESMLKDTKPVTVEMKDVDLNEALDIIFKDQPLSFKVEDKMVVIKPKEPNFIDKVIARFQEIDVRGRVTDSEGHALSGASVVVKGSGKGTGTNSNGEFYLAGIHDDAVLIISFMGYVTKEVKVKAELGNLSLEMSNSKLDEVQVIAYGTVNKKFSTSNIGTVTSEDIARQPINNPILALQGRVPGLFVAATNGLPGSSVKVTIQGLNSFRPEGQSPFFVVDGVPYAQNFTSQSLNVNAVSNGGAGGSTMNFINPADIESISILKDADATAIYGSRAANGAILITTKKGKAGKTKVGFNLQQGLGNLAHKYKYLNTQQYLEMRKEAYANKNLPLPTPTTTPTPDNYDLTVWDQNRYTDWQKVLVGNTAHYTNVDASVSGGSANTQFLLGYGYNRQTTVYPNPLADQKANIHFNINNTSTDGKFNVMVNASYLYDHNRLNGTDLMLDAIRLAPNAPSLYNSDGTLNWGPLASNPSVYTFTNPMGIALRPYTGLTSNLTANNSISYEISRGLKLKVTMGYNKLQGDETSTNPVTTIKPDLPDKTRTAAFLNKAISSWILEPQVTFAKATSFGTFEALLGSTLQQSNTNVLLQIGSNYSNDGQLNSLQAAPTVFVANEINNVYKYNAVFGRLNYRLKDKYILNLTARRDGSSRFGDANKFHTFYALGGAWLFGEENFSKSALPWLSMGKVRANYGTTGNDQIDDYTYESLLSSVFAEQHYLGVVGIYPTNIVNPYLQWEETRKFNLGLDLGFLKNRLEVSANYFRNRSSNQLLKPQLPYTTGFQFVTTNFPATIQNTGIELMLSGTPIKSENFTWQASINFTIPRNKLVEYPGLATSTDVNNYFIGEAINVVRRYKFAGVNPETGYYEFYNAKGEKTYSPNSTTDRFTRLDPNPKYYGGLSSTISYKGFQFDFLFQGVKQLGPNYRLGNIPGTFNTNQPISVLERWQVPGQITEIQKFGNGASDVDALNRFSRANGSDIAYTDASYIRLKNAAVSYTIANESLKKIRISSARIFMQGQNLLTFTKYIGTDPETKNPGVLPPLRIFTLGAQFSF